MATGLGKTVTFANIPRHGRTLILSHREELVRQPLKYFDCIQGVCAILNKSSFKTFYSAGMFFGLYTETPSA